MIVFQGVLPPFLPPGSPSPLRQGVICVMPMDGQQHDILNENPPTDPPLDTYIHASYYT